jgi:hypothetical protein
MGVHVMAEGAIVSCKPIPMRPQLVQCRSGLSDGGEQNLTTSSELISRKSLDHQIWKSLALGVVPGDSIEVRGGGIHIKIGRVGEERGGKEIDGCHLTLPPPLFKAQHHNA